MIASNIPHVDVEQYNSNGYQFPIPVMDASEAESWRGELESFEQAWRDEPSLPEPLENYFRANLHVVSTAAARLAAHPVITDVVSQVLGDDLMCWMAELIIKDPHTAKVLSVHQDLTYWGLAAGDRLVTAWLALSDVTVANGAMKFVTGSHRLGQVEHHDTYSEDNLLSRGQEVEVEYDSADEVDVELKPGEISLHHGHMFHGSGPNTTDERRIGLVLRYLDPSVQSTKGRDFAMPVRGVVRSTHMQATAPPPSDFHPASIKLHREITDYQNQSLTEDATDQFGYSRGSA